MFMFKGNSNDTYFNSFLLYRYLAIDETDRMSEKGHFAELEKILEVVQGGEGKKQKFVMSATLSLVHRAPFYKKGELKELSVEPSSFELFFSA